MRDGRPGACHLLAAVEAELAWLVPPTPPMRGPNEEEEEEEEGREAERHRRGHRLMRQGRPARRDCGALTAVEVEGEERRGSRAI